MAASARNLRAFSADQVAFPRLRQIPAAHLHEHRAEELALVDDAIADLMPIARDHNHPRSAIEAWNAVRGWAERKAKLLGLDAPKQTEVRNIDEIDVRLLELAEQVDLGETGSYRSQSP